MDKGNGRQRNVVAVRCRWTPIHGERTDWIPRARHILAGETRPFETFDRMAQFTESQGKSLGELLETFADLRRENVAALAGMNLTKGDLERKGLHPELGEVTLGQLLATWVVHDLDHVAQIARTMAKAYGEATGRGGLIFQSCGTGCR
jgi:hypothetical protein